MSKLLDLSGQVFGSLMVERRGPDAPSGQVRWECSCVCGKKTLVYTKHLRSGATRSCGCRSAYEPVTAHGEARRGNRSPEYRVWVGIKARCLNPNFWLYKYYGGRGIKISERWVGEHGYENFVADVGRKPSSDHSLDRIDNDGDYAPGNVRWATRREQARNTRRNRAITWRGKSRILVEWAEHLQIPYKVLHNRLNKCGWSVDRAFTTPYTRRT